VGSHSTKGKPSHAELVHRVKELEKEVLERTIAERDARDLERQVVDRTRELERANEELRLEIAEGTRTDEALAETLHRYRLLTESTSDIIWTADMDLRFTYLSPSVHSFIGYAPEELLGHTIMDHLTPSSAETGAKRLLQALAQNDKGLSDTPRSHPLELLRVHKDGSEVWGEVTFTILRDATGNPKAILGVTRDITERKRTEKWITRMIRLKEALLKYGSLYEKLELITGAVVDMFDADFSRIWITRAADLCDGGCAHTRITEGPHVCRRRDRCLHLMSSSGRYTHIDGEWHRRVPIGSYKIGRIAAEEDTKFLTNDVPHDPRVHDHGWARRLGLVSFAGYRLLDSDGSPLGVLALFSKHAISPREDSLLEDLANTTAQVIQGKKEEEERRKMESKMRDAQRLESLGVMAGGIAHDFNNLLTPILANISIAKTYGKLDDEIADLLTDAEKASLRAKGLAQQLLTFARGGEPIRRTIHISGLLRETARLALSGSSARCEFSLPEDLWLVDADEAQLGQVIQNVVLNADQAMAEGGIIKIYGKNVILKDSPYVTAEDDRCVRISIEDHGCGIPEKQVSKVFDPFFTTKEKGRGMGLTTTYSIVKRHGGHIHVSSMVGVGTRLDIYLPASQNTSASEGTKRLNLVRGEGRLLLIDDEDIVRRSAKETMERLGYEVELAGEGGEGIELYKKAKDSGQPFSAVVMDLTIPGGMGGKRAIQKLIEMDPQAKVIVSSGYSNDPVMSNFRDYGFSGVLRKPYNIEQLGEVLHKVIAEGD